MLKFRFDTKGVLRLIALFHPLCLDLFSRSLHLKNPMFEYIWDYLAGPLNKE